MPIFLFKYIVSNVIISIYNVDIWNRNGVIAYCYRSSGKELWSRSHFGKTKCSVQLKHLICCKLYLIYNNNKVR